MAWCYRCCQMQSPADASSGSLPHAIELQTYSSFSHGAEPTLLHAPGSRRILFGGDRLRSDVGMFVGNAIRTTRYTVVTFLPKCLLEQFGKAANCYFLFITTAMWLGSYTGLFANSIPPSTTGSILSIMLFASMALAFADDQRRRHADVRTNSQKALIMDIKSPGSAALGVIAWSDVRVGDILVLRSDEELPADVVILATSGEEGICYVSTANLDGETNLKVKGAADPSQLALASRAGSEDQAADHSFATASHEEPLLNRAMLGLSTWGGEVVVEAPQPSIHTFNGCMRARRRPPSPRPPRHGEPLLEESNGQDGEVEEDIEMGVGPGPAECKGLAATATAAVEDVVNHTLSSKNVLLRGTKLRNTAWCLGLVVYTGGDTRMARNQHPPTAKMANLERSINRTIKVVMGLQVTMALVSDLLYCSYKHVFAGFWYLFPDGKQDTHILPDPIGYFLTFFLIYSNLLPISLYAQLEMCNFCQAHFIKNDLSMYDEPQDCPAAVRSTNLCHELGQVSYIFSDKTGTLTQNVMELKQISVAGSIFGEAKSLGGFCGGKALLAARAQSPRHAQDIDALLEIMAVAHTVVALPGDRHGELRYEAESPDEGALVDAASDLGLVFSGRSAGALCVRGYGEYEILALNAFTSDRKRMSVVVRSPEGKNLLLVKGADEVVLERAEHVDACISEHLSVFARGGLRTLVFGRRELPDEELAAWLPSYEEAQLATVCRQEMLAEVADKLEVRLRILGATGIEDKLQDDVAETIRKIHNAGIHLWVLTGDKMETAVNIAHSTGLINHDMEIMTCTTDDAGACSVDGSRRVEASLAEQLEAMSKRADDAADIGRKAALVLTGRYLEQVSRAEATAALLSITERCATVVACRFSPWQKAQVVQLVRQGVKSCPVTMAVGDGANDVPMIQAAQVGVGISGKEGRQAADASDFSIAQFRFLQRLLLVHGHWNHRRACKFILYTFWKNAVLTLMLFYYTLISGFSGTSMFEPLTWASFNAILAFPVIATGVFDRDVDAKQALDHPWLYATGRERTDLNSIKMVETMVSAFLHSMILLGVIFLAYNGLDMADLGDYFTFSTATYSWLVMAMNYRVAFITTTWNVMTVLALLSSFLMYITFIVVYSLFAPSLGQPMMHGVCWRLAAAPLFWIGSLAVPAFAMMTDVFKAYLMLEILPDSVDLVLETQKAGKQLQVELVSECSVQFEDRALERSFTDSPNPRQPRMWSPQLSEDRPFARCLTTPLDDTATRQLSRSGRHSDPHLEARSFCFDHAEGPPRHHRALGRAISAGRASLKILDFTPSVGSLRAFRGFSGDQSSTSVAPPSQRPWENAFAQQTLPSWQFVLTWERVTLVSLSLAGILLFGGVVVNTLSQGVQRMSIQYDGEPSSSFFDETDAFIACPVAQGGQTRICELKVNITEDMQPPILLHYTLTHFFQNYDTYMQSVLYEELNGHVAPEWYRRDKCPGPTRRTSEGKAIVPCGLQTMSLFNDTFEFVDSDIEVSSSGIAQRSDFEFLHNPADFPDRVNTTWLHEVFPSVLTPDRGVRNERLASWLRPSALPIVTKAYGRINTALRKGVLNVRIKASFPTSSLGVRKHFVLSTTTFLGGRNRGLIRSLVVASLLCVVFAVCVLLIRSTCPRMPGKRRRFPCSRKLSTSSVLADVPAAVAFAR